MEIARLMPLSESEKERRPGHFLADLLAGAITPAHLVDSGLAATLAGLRPGDWIAKRDRMGHLLESFVAHQFVTQAGWTDPDIRFWHFRDKDGQEVDLVMTLGSRTWGIEVKGDQHAGTVGGPRNDAPGGAVRG